ncbi:MAG: glycosyltransferase family 2 protein [Mycoplasmatales bacterium]|nr:glycosyltransferase family 2 protein [Mycoplasmatales bacterium]
MKYSILVCAYNAEKFIKECLNSLVSQSINKKEYEIILINDGSNDNTRKIAEKFDDVKIFNQENQGLSAARNKAIQLSKGEWIVFVDADDYISLDFLEIAEKYKNDDSKNFIVMKELKDYKAEKIDNKIQQNKMDDSVAGRIIQRNLFDNYKFPSKYKYAIEDWDFYVHKIKEIKPLDLRNKKSFYFYRYNDQSLSKSNKVYRSRLEHALSIFENEKLRKNNLEENIVGHHYEHLYMMSKLWFPDLLPRVKKIKFRSKIRISTKIQFYIVKLGILNWIIRRTQEKKDI